MWNRFRNIQTILFSTYSLIIVIVFTVLMVWLYLWASDLLRNNATDSLESLGQSMRDQVDSELQKMNDVSLNVMYSNLVKNNFKRYLSDLEGKQTIVEGALPPIQSSVENAKELAEILTAAIGPSRPVEQIYLYDFEGKAYGNGYDSGERSYSPASKPWYETVVNNTAGKYIDLPVLDWEMSRFISSREQQYSLSLFRLFYDNYNVPMGIIEVKQYYNRIFKSIIEFEAQSPYAHKVLVYNDQGQIIYPIAAPEDFRQLAQSYIQLFDALEPQSMSEAYTAYENPISGESELLSYHPSGIAEWNTVIIASEKMLLQPVHTFAKQTVLVACIILLFAILLSFIAAKRITFPILRIHRAIRSMRLEDLGSERVTQQDLNSGLNELDQLHLSFQKMSSRLKQSMDELLLSQSQEMQAKLIALQSQMNPHFLYNTLATIHVMAEENMTTEIVAMTENMSDFLRYFSSDESIVSLHNELLHTEKYLEINQIRYGSKLKYEMNIDARMQQLRIPKLIVQPLVENALKFGTQKEPPWLIRVQGTLTDEQWRIEVSDNGHGFTEASLAHLQQRIAEMNHSGVIPVLKLDGMGLLNIYIRLKLNYGEAAIFEIRNEAPHGATIVIGGGLT